MKGLNLSSVVRIAAICALGAIVLSGCGNGSASTTPPEPGSAEPETPPVPVETTQVSAGSISATYQGTATLEAAGRADVVAKTTGVVLDTLVEEGDQVEQGQVLARLEKDRYRLEVERTGATLERLEQELKRARELHNRDLMSSDEFDRARFEYQQQKAQHELMQLELRYTDIRAPIDGIVSERLIRTGNLVTEHQPVYSIDKFDPLWAVLHVPERELDRLEPGQPVAMRLDAFPDAVFSGKVLRVSPVVDPETGTFKVTAELDDDPRLRPGLFARVSIIHDTRDNATLVSRDAVLSEDGNSAVFVVDAEGKVTRRAIRVGYQQDDVVEVLEGLEPGASVVTAGKGNLRDGARVESVQS